MQWLPLDGLFVDCVMSHGLLTVLFTVLEHNCLPAAIQRVTERNQSCSQPGTVINTRGGGKNKLICEHLRHPQGAHSQCIEIWGLFNEYSIRISIKKNTT